MDRMGAQIIDLKKFTENKSVYENNKDLLRYTGHYYMFRGPSHFFTLKYSCQLNTCIFERMSTEYWPTAKVNADQEKCD